jgi:transposase-like protein
MGKLTPEEVKVLIKASRIAREKGLKPGSNVKEICKQAGISRKTGYQWLKQDDAAKKKKDEGLQKLIHRKVDYQKLLAENTRLRFENEGIHLAMEIHGMNDVIKKNSI